MLCEVDYQFCWQDTTITTTDGLKSCWQRKKHLKLNYTCPGHTFQFVSNVMNLLLPGINFEISCKKYLFFLNQGLYKYFDEQIAQGKAWKKSTLLLTFSSSLVYTMSLSP